MVGPPHTGKMSGNHMCAPFAKISQHKKLLYVCLAKKRH